MLNDFIMNNISEALRCWYSMLTDLSINDPPAFMCHFYNIYFAHSAGGRMIGKKISSMCLEDAELDFYKWDGELSDLLGKVHSKEKI